MYTVANNGTSSTGSWEINVPSGAAGTLNTDWRCALAGKLLGGGTFNYVIPSGSVRSDIHGDWSTFGGRINVTTTGASGDFRMDLDYNWPGIPSASLNLGANISAYYSGNLNQGNGTIVPIGELMSTGTGMTLRGGGIGGRQITYRIGDRDTDATFAGNILEQTNGLTNITKTGLGTWTLSGSSNYLGQTTVESGTLLLSGTIINPVDAMVMTDAVFKLSGNGRLVAPSIYIADGGTLTGSGTVNGSIINDGLVSCSGGSLKVTGDVVNNASMRFTVASALVVTGTLTNYGVLDIMTGSQQLPENFANYGVVLDSSAVRMQSFVRSGTTLQFTIQSAVGHNYQLQKTVTLNPPSWTNLGQAQAGNDAVLTFAEPGMTGARGFYRIQVSP